MANLPSEPRCTGFRHTLRKLVPPCATFLPMESDTAPSIKDEPWYGDWLDSEDSRAEAYLCETEPEKPEPDFPDYEDDGVF